MIGKLAIVLLSACTLLMNPDSAYPAQDTNLIRSIYVPKVPLKDVRSSIWKSAPPARIKVIPQNMTPPFLETPSIEHINVRSVHNRDWIAFLVEWEDKTRDGVVDVAKFTDQVAIQLPIDPSSLPAFMMGNKGGRVHIIHWKAIWQDDIEKGYRDVQTIHPNYWVDLYFFSEPMIYAEGEFPRQPTTSSYFITPESLNYMPGAYARNPVSILHRSEPVEEAIAEGFGTFTTQPKQNAVGWGKWENGKWRVIIARPIVTDDPNDAPMLSNTFAAFAVWNGSDKNIGARKHYSTWVEVKIE
ncbi:MAG: ethylbenzene dehydrogenase-related protein [Candidatus Caldarchaeum sp.]